MTHVSRCADHTLHGHSIGAVDGLNQHGLPAGWSSTTCSEGRQTFRSLFSCFDLDTGRPGDSTCGDRTFCGATQTLCLGTAVRATKAQGSKSSGWGRTTAADGPQRSKDDSFGAGASGATTSGDSTRQKIEVKNERKATLLPLVRSMVLVMDSSQTIFNKWLMATIGLRVADVVHRRWRMRSGGRAWKGSKNTTKNDNLQNWLCNGHFRRRDSLRVTHRSSGWITSVGHQSTPCCSPQGLLTARRKARAVQLHRTPETGGFRGRFVSGTKMARRHPDNIQGGQVSDLAARSCRVVKLDYAVHFLATFPCLSNV